MNISIIVALLGESKKQKTTHCRYSMGNWLFLVKMVPSVLRLGISLNIYIIIKRGPIAGIKQFTRSHSAEGTVSLVGITLAFLSACGYAGFILCGRLLSNSYHPFQISSVAFGTGALLLLVCAASTRLVLVYPTWGWLLLLYLGSIPTALGYGFFQVGIRSVSATVASIVTMCEPLTATVLAWILFHEELGPFGLLGAGFLLGAMVVILLVPKKYFEKGK
jgi:drug/metabolite transporter (DMT)-like permease